jgi:ribonucleoside-triphosphate reductase
MSVATMNGTINVPHINTRYASKLPNRIVDAMKEVKVPWGPVGYVTYKRTYSRHSIPKDRTSPKEEYWQSIARCLQGLLDINGALTLRELECAAEYFMNLKMQFSGRQLWQLGTKTVERLGGDSLQACWHVRVNEPIHPFCFNFEELMLGGGVGFTIMPEDVYSIPIVKHVINVTRVDTFDCDYIIPDNREGWVELLRKILDGFFFSGKSITYNTKAIRSRGEPIESFGGTASGPEDLVLGINQIVKILHRCHGRKLNPIDAMDIQNILAQIVVAGNVRRSAQIACGSGRDRDFLLAKYWDDGSIIIPKWRQQSNNTVVEEDLHALLPEFWWPYENVNIDGSSRGECYGLFNKPLSANYGRLIDGVRPGYNAGVCGPNPCGEIMLESDEACNLAELYLTNLRDSTEFHIAATLMYKVTKIVSVVPFLHPRTNEVVGRNHRLGIGITGVQAAHHLRKAEIFNGVYKHIREEDKEYSNTLNTTESIAYTTVKPSGTSAKLPIGCPPGANLAYANPQLLRITFSSDSPMLPTLRKKGYPMEPKRNLDGSSDLNSLMVSFPIAYPEGTPCDGDLSAVQQLENVKFLQTYWSDNAVSATVQFKQEEVPEIKAWMFENYKDSLKSISFSRHTGHGFIQPPNEPLTWEQYYAFVASVEPLDHFENDQDDSAIEGIECGTGGCPVK